jgi:hypothetical protein
MQAIPRRFHKCNCFVTNGICKNGTLCVGIPLHFIWVITCRKPEFKASPTTQKNIVVCPSKATFGAAT